MAMKLGSQTGSLVNHVMSGGSPKPEVGMGATILHWTDRTAATVTWVSKSGKTLGVTVDEVERIDDNGMSEVQEYRYTSRPDGAPIEFRLCKRGWKRVGCGDGLALGVRRQYHDYSF